MGGRDPESVLDVRGLRVLRPSGDVVVDGLDLIAVPGRTVAIVGESSSGKTIAARSLIGLAPRGFRVEGSIKVKGRETVGADAAELRAIRGRTVAMSLQDPFTALNPVMTVGDQLTELAVDIEGRRPRKGARRAEAERRLAEVGIVDATVVDRYPFQLSGGMRQRVGLAAAVAGDPDVLIADEPTTALDVTTQAEVLGLLAHLRRTRHMALVLITHDLRVASAVADDIVVLYAGSVLESGPTTSVLTSPRHPYTAALLQAEPSVAARATELRAIPGQVPAAADVTRQCAFASRCPYVDDRCTGQRPVLADQGGSHLSRCVRPSVAARLEVAPRIAQPPQPGVAAGSPTLLRVAGAHRSFPANSRRSAATPALSGVSLEVHASECLAVVGESGSGKTTLGRCIVGLETLDAGSVEFRTEPESPKGPRNRPPRAQMVFQDPYSSLNPMMSVQTTLRESLRWTGTGRKRRDRRVRELMDLVGLSPALLRRRPVALSGGQRQRVAIARALALEPDLLVCDEPVSALDVSVQAQIINLLNQLRTSLGLTYVFITHDLGVVRQVADRVLVMHHGKVVEQGDVGQVLDHPAHAYTKSLLRSIPSAPQPAIKENT